MSERQDETGSKTSTGSRMRKWRERQRQRLGGLVQVLVWVRSEHESSLRNIFEKLADPDWIGEAYREAAAPWLARNRPPAVIYEALETKSEIDRPILRKGADVWPIGGRIFGIGDTLVELTPKEAKELNERIRTALEKVHTEFIDEKQFQDRIRDTTGVIAQEQATYLRGTKEMVLEYKVDRPEGDLQFWANEEAIANSVLSLKEGTLEHLGGGNFLYDYAGLHRFPSRCLVVTSLHHPEFQTSSNHPLVALVKLEHSGTPPAVCFERLATEVRLALLPQTPPSAILWYDAGRNILDASRGLQITRVKLDRDKQFYQNPVWLHDEPRNHDFFRFIQNSLTSYEAPAAPPQGSELSPEHPDYHAISSGKYA